LTSRFLLLLPLLNMSRSKEKLAKVKVNISKVANSLTLIFPEFDFLKLNIL